MPSALWPSKLDRGNALNPTELEIGHFGLQNINFLPTLPGLYMGFLPPPLLIAMLALLGLLAGSGERLLFRYSTPPRLVLLAGATTAALLYEQGLPGMLIALRSAATIAIIVKLVEVVRVRRDLRHSAALQDHWHSTCDDNLQPEERQLA